MATTTTRLFTFVLLVILPVGPATAQEKLNLCLAMAEGSRGEAASWVDDFQEGGSWPNKDPKNLVYSSVRAMTSLDDRRGCDAIASIRLVDNIWRDRVTADVLSGISGTVLYRGPADGWLIKYSYVVDYVANELRPGAKSYNAIRDEMQAQCRSSTPPDTPMCVQMAAQQREQEASAKRWAAQQAERDEASIREKIPAWRALKPKPPLPEEARKFRVLAEDAIKEKRFEDAAGYYERGLRIEPMWPEGHYNLALLDGELKKYAQAASHMRLYLEMVPNAKDAAAARDKVIIWEEKAKRPSAEAPASPPPSSPMSVANDTLVDASARGRYSGLLQTLECPRDKGTYGTFKDFGYWSGGTWCGQKGVGGYWVYAFPTWYVWQTKN